MVHVCLISEGAYPYVAGGVGQWTYNLIRSLPDVRFTVVALWTTPGTEGAPRYPLSPNVVELRTHYLVSGAPSHGKVNAEGMQCLKKFHERLKHGDVKPFSAVVEHLDGGGFFRESPAWELLTQMYTNYAPAGTSFPDYYWTWRATHLPLLRMLEVRLPACSLVHCISTGYAGLLGALHRVRAGIPMVTTEHGLYTRERSRDIQDAEWIPGEEQAERRRAPNKFREWWQRMFLGMERIAYRNSDRVIALFEENRRYQIAHGAPEERTLVIPNGIDLGAYDAVRRRRRSTGEFRVGLVGRVVPIKDILTFIAACKIVADRLKDPPFRAFIIGPEDEDEAYARQCHEMVGALGLDDTVRFTGRVNVATFYETMDVVVLTSLSEGQPLALLEGHACGIPAVATDVGSCREILEERTDADRSLGPSGVVAPVSDPPATAEALLALARDPAHRNAMGDAGHTRVERIYRWDQVCRTYSELYRSLADGRN
ncbi:MAG: GT4 family glycosyltransferase PelF [Planctomycetes bacterium]|nr:GT4 family glycosyltransferase PelF [Planctomycetota bacterium]